MRCSARKENEMENKINIPVQVENIEELQKLLAKADKQFEGLKTTLDELEACRLSISVKLNQ